MKSNDKYYAKFAIGMIASVLNKTEFAAVPEDFDWDGFTHFCSKHSILNLVCFCVNSLQNVPPKTALFYQEAMLRSIAKEAQREEEISALADDFEKNCIKHLIIKGFVIKNMYPLPQMRSMSDVDIVIDNIESASKIALDKGFNKTGDEFLHVSFSKKPSLHVELHKSLIDESIEDLYAYFKTGFERAVLTEGYSYRYEFTKEDFYIFLIAHLSKHFKLCGTGIRSIVDIYVFRSFNKEKLNNDYIYRELEKIGLKTFAVKCEQLAEKWFLGCFNGEFDSVGEYIISSGTFGTSDNHELNAFIADTKEKSFKQSKHKYILRCIFPNKAYMSARYKAVKKAPFLIPIFWIVRIFSTLFKSRGSIRYRLKGVIGSNESDFDKFKETGLH